MNGNKDSTKKLIKLDKTDGMDVLIKDSFNMDQLLET